MGALGKATTFWTGLSGPGRRLIIGAAVTFAIGLFLLMRLSGAADYSTLASANTPADAAAITKELDAKGIPYRTRDGGVTIQVPSGQLNAARLDLAASNLLAGGGSSVGFEIFDKQGWGATDFTQRVNLQRAMQGELERTITQLDQVQSAQVSLAMPTERLFQQDSKPTTASVLLTLVPGATLDPAQVSGVSRLVAMAVPGLDAKNVSITDTQGNILNAGSGDNSAASGASTRIQLEAAYEQRTQAKLDAMLASVLGPGMAVAQVNAVLDLDKKSSVSEEYDPKKKGAKNVIPLNTDISKETLKTKGGGSGSAAGASANTPGNTFPVTSSGSGTTDYAKNGDRVQNGVDRVVTNTEGVGGTLVRQSVSVQVSDKFTGSVPDLQKAIEAAVGVDSQRGDQVVVQKIAFAKEALATKNASGSNSAPAGAPMDIMGIAKKVGAGIGLLLILMMARKSLKRRQSELEKALPELLARGPVPVAELAGMGAMPRRLEGETKSGVERQMEDLALRKPDDMAKLMRSWLIERR